MSKRIHIQDEADLEQAEKKEDATDTVTADSEASEEASPEERTSEKASEEPTSLARQLELAEQKADDHYDKLLRVSAEFDNYKKRTAREMQDVVKYANEKLIKELLTVVDNLERAIGSAAGRYDESDPLIQGMQLTLNETLKILERYKVKPVLSLGEPFDPTYHQAMMQEEADDQPPNTVVKELQKGYLIHDRLLRPALVAVSKAGSTEKKENQTEH